MFSPKRLRSSTVAAIASSGANAIDDAAAVGAMVPSSVWCGPRAE